MSNPTQTERRTDEDYLDELLDVLNFRRLTNTVKYSFRTLFYKGNNLTLCKVCDYNGGSKEYMSKLDQRYHYLDHVLKSEW